ncbi:MAG: hypothetical protein ACP5QZ_11590 [Candidatus Sumerlaeaceae bacterium]|jgi:hypothetical protein
MNDSARFAVRGAFLGLGMLLGTIAFAAPETFESLAQKADAIVVGKCVSKNCVVRRGVFVTTHQVQIGETLKGKSVRAGDTVSVATLGGTLKTPPLTQFVNDQPEILEGEDVLLFLQQPANTSAQRKSAIPELASSARVVGGAKGKYSVITDPKDNKRKVVNVRCEDYGVMPDDRLLRTILRALEKGELQTTDTTQLQDLGGGVRGPESAKPILDNAVRITESLRVVKPDQFQQTMRTNAKPVPAPTLEEVKAKISRAVAK